MSNYVLCTNWKPAFTTSIKYYEQKANNIWVALDQYGNELTRVETSSEILRLLFNGELSILASTPKFEEQFEWPRVFRKNFRSGDIYYILAKDYSLEFIDNGYLKSASMSDGHGGISKDVSNLGTEVSKEVRELVLMLRAKL